MLSQNPNYVITIECNISPNRQPIVVQANMPETISLGVNSDWESRLPANAFELVNNVVGAAIGNTPLLGGVAKGLEYVNAGVQQLYGINPIFQALTHPSWTGSTPLEFNLQLLFDANTDAVLDVLMPAINLLMIAMPYKGDINEFNNQINDVVGDAKSTATRGEEMNKIYHSSFEANIAGHSFSISPENVVDAGAAGYKALYKYINAILPNDNILFPPGPSIMFPDRSKTSFKLGKLLFIPSVLIPQVNLTFDSRLDVRGVPISAIAEVTIRTTTVPSRDDILSFFQPMDTANFWDKYGTGPVLNGRI